VYNPVYNGLAHPNSHQRRGQNEEHETEPSPAKRRRGGTDSSHSSTTVTFNQEKTAETSITDKAAVARNQASTEELLLTPQLSRINVSPSRRIVAVYQKKTQLLAQHMQTLSMNDNGTTRPRSPKLTGPPALSPNPQDTKKLITTKTPSSVAPVKEAPRASQQEIQHQQAETVIVTVLPQQQSEKQQATAMPIVLLQQRPAPTLLPQQKPRQQQGVNMPTVLLQQQLQQQQVTAPLPPLPQLVVQQQTPLITRAPTPLTQHEPQQQQTAAPPAIQAPTTPLASTERAERATHNSPGTSATISDLMDTREEPNTTTPEIEMMDATQNERTELAEGAADMMQDILYIPADDNSEEDMSDGGSQ
jgi:hypothetical protein